MGQLVAKMDQIHREKNRELDLAQEIYADREYVEMVENTDLHDKIKKIISEHGHFTGFEIDDFVRENLNRPVLEEIFNAFKGNEDIRNAMKKYGVTTEQHYFVSNLTKPIDKMFLT